MGWYNGGDWSNLNGADMPYVLADLATAIDERLALTGDPAITHRISDNTFKSDPEVADYVGIQLFSDLFDDIKQEMQTNTRSLFSDQAWTESGTDYTLWTSTNMLTATGYAGYENPDTFNTNFWHQLKDMLDKFIFVTHSQTWLTPTSNVQTNSGSPYVSTPALAWASMSSGFHNTVGFGVDYEIKQNLVGYNAANSYRTGYKGTVLPSIPATYLSLTTALSVYVSFVTSNYIGSSTFLLNNIRYSAPPSGTGYVDADPADLFVLFTNNFTLKPGGAYNSTDFDYSVPGLPFRWARLSSSSVRWISDVHLALTDQT